MGERYRDVQVVIIGDSGVGKTCVLTQFVSRTFDKLTDSTIGAAFVTRVLRIDGQLVKFHIWDTAGQEIYRSLAPIYYKTAHIAIIMYDITSRDSLAAVDYWLNDVRAKGPEGVQVVICGNKTDLEPQREVSREEGRTIAEREGSLFQETSARTGVGVDDLFINAYRRLPAPAPEAEAFRSELVDLQADGPGHASGSGGAGAGAGSGSGKAGTGGSSGRSGPRCCGS